MPMYEYRCEGCGQQFEIVQSVHARPEDTVCPHCHAQKAIRLLSAFASKVVGDHKPTYSEMKAYSMLNERMHKFSKLPPIFGKRADLPPMETYPGQQTPSSTTDRGSEHSRPQV